jgi:hypothetical protein
MIKFKFAASCTVRANRQHKWYRAMAGGYSKFWRLYSSSPGPFDMPFGRLTVLSEVEGLTALSIVEGLTGGSRKTLL